MNQKSLTELYNVAVATVGDLVTPSGQLNANVLLTNLFNKIATQTTINTFKFNHELVSTYAKRSSLYGDIDEVNSVIQEELRKDWKDNPDWPKTKKFLQAVSTWVASNIDDQYIYSLSDVQMQRAFKGETQYGNMLAQMRNVVYNNRKVVWYDRIIKHYENDYKNIIEIETDLVGVELQKYLLKLLKNMTFPSTAYNVGATNGTPGKLNSCELSELQMTWNLDEQIDFQSDISLNFNSMDVPRLKEIFTARYAKFTDPSIVCVIDTSDTIRIALETSYANYQVFAENRYTNYYFNDLYKTGVIPFATGIVIKRKAAPAKK